MLLEGALKRECINLFSSREYDGVVETTQVLEPCVKRLLGPYAEITRLLTRQGARFVTEMGKRLSF